MIWAVCEFVQVPQPFFTKVYFDKVFKLVLDHSVFVMSNLNQLSIDSGFRKSMDLKISDHK